MKYLAYCVSLLTLFVSCKKETVQDKSSINAHISEVSDIWNSNTVDIKSNDSLLELYGCSGNTDGSVAITNCVVLAIRNYSGPGTYNMPDINQTYFSHSVKGYNTIHSIVDGFIKISSETGKSIDGTFEFRAYNNPIIDTITVNSGKFHIVK
jgi:hypothetical protein